MKRRSLKWAQPCFIVVVALRSSALLLSSLPAITVTTTPSGTSLPRATTFKWSIKRDPLGVCESEQTRLSKNWGELEGKSHVPTTLNDLWHWTEGCVNKTERWTYSWVAHSESSWQGLVAPPVLWQAAAEKVWAVGLYQTSGWCCAAVVQRPHLLLIMWATVRWWHQPTFPHSIWKRVTHKKLSTFPCLFVLSYKMLEAWLFCLKQEHVYNKESKWFVSNFNLFHILFKLRLMHLHLLMCESKEAEWGQNWSTVDIPLNQPGIRNRGETIPTWVCFQAGILELASPTNSGECKNTVMLYFVSQGHLFSTYEVHHL